MEAYEKCPICLKTLMHIKRFDKPCGVINGTKCSFVESVCNSGLEDMQHIFFQVASLDGVLIFEKIHFPHKGFEAEINHSSCQSKMILFHKPTRESLINPALGKPPDTFVYNNALLQFDYPHLDKLLNKVKMCRVFS